MKKVFNVFDLDQDGSINVDDVEIENKRNWKRGQNVSKLRNILKLVIFAGTSLGIQEGWPSNVDFVEIRVPHKAPQRAL